MFEAAARARAPPPGVSVRGRLPPSADTGTASEPGRPQRPFVPRLSLESHLNAELANLGVIERSECRRPQVRLHVGRQERVQRIPHAYADPRLKLENLEAMLEADFEACV